LSKPLFLRSDRAVSDLFKERIEGNAERQSSCATVGSVEKNESGDGVMREIGQFG
jgi:hypothetical protein